MGLGAPGATRSSAGAPAGTTHGGNGAHEEGGGGASPRRGASETPSRALKLQLITEPICINYKARGECLKSLRVPGQQEPIWHLQRGPKGVSGGRCPQNGTGTPLCGWAGGSRAPAPSPRPPPLPRTRPRCRGDWGRHGGTGRAGWWDGVCGGAGLTRGGGCGVCVCARTCTAMPGVCVRAPPPWLRLPTPVGVELGGGRVPAGGCRGGRSRCHGAMATGPAPARPAGLRRLGQRGPGGAPGGASGPQTGRAQAPGSATRGRPGSEPRAREGAAPGPAPRRPRGAPSLPGVAPLQPRRGAGGRRGWERVPQPHGPLHPRVGKPGAQSPARARPGNGCPSPVGPPALAARGPGAVPVPVPVPGTAPRARHRGHGPARPPLPEPPGGRGGTRSCPPAAPVPTPRMLGAGGRPRCRPAELSARLSRLPPLPAAVPGRGAPRGGVSHPSRNCRDSSAAARRPPLPRRGS